MSQTRPDACPNASISNFQLVLESALEAYEKKSKSKRLAYSLAAQLQTCDSPDAIISVLNDLIQQIDRRRSSDQRLTTWLGPTVEVLHVFCTTLSEADLVRLNSLSS